jgi:hypothetical protein
MSNEFKVKNGLITPSIKSNNDVLDLIGNGAVIIPVGTTEQRPDPASAGMFRFNTTLGSFEGYDGVEWVEIQAGFTFEGDLDTLSGTEDLESGSGTVDLNQ